MPPSRSESGGLPTEETALDAQDSLHDDEEQGTSDGPAEPPATADKYAKKHWVRLACVPTLSIACNFTIGAPQWTLQSLGTYEQADALSVLCSGPSLLAEYSRNVFQFYRNSPQTFGKECLAGVVVAIMQLPESIAFSYVAGVHPLVGLHSTFILGLVAAMVGGKAAMISGAAGALAVVARVMTADSGPLGHLSVEARRDHLFLAMVFCGVAQIVVGLLGLGRLTRMIPATAMTGFMNGLAIVIFLAQLPAFQVCDQYPLFYSCKEAERLWLPADQARTWITVVLSLVSMAIMFLWPLVPRVGKLLPSPLVSIVVGTVFEHLINRPFIQAPTRTIGETAPIYGTAPLFHAPWETTPSIDWATVLRFGASFAAIGLIESVMTLQAVNEITNTMPTTFAMNQECVAQGIGNFVCGLFGGMGGDTMIGQSTVNIASGARGRLSGIVAAIGVLIIVVAASPAVNLVPIGVLTGILFAIVIKTFNWNTFRTLVRVSRLDAFVILLVTVLAVFTDLAIAVVSGVIVTSLASTWQSGRLIRVDKSFHLSDLVLDADDELSSTDDDGETPPRKAVYQITGSLFFASTRTFLEHFDVANDPDDVFIDLRHSLIADFSAVEAIRVLGSRYHELGKRLHVFKLCDKSEKRLAKHMATIGDVVRMSTEDLLLRDPAARVPPISPALSALSHPEGVVLGDLKLFTVPEPANVDQVETELESMSEIEMVQTHPSPKATAPRRPSEAASAAEASP
jgi:sulfate permease, SulP family